MILPLAQATTLQGTAAAETAKLFAHTTVTAGYVLGPEAMEASLDERREQIDSLLRVRDEENAERVAEDLRDVILTIHVPKQVEEALEEAFEALNKPVLMRLSPIGAIANPLEPTIIIGLEDKKSVLDALRMLYAEMYTAANLATEDKNRSTAIIIQSQPPLEHSFRALGAGTNTVIEAEHGLGAWVGYGEPERFLFTGEELKAQEAGDVGGIFWSDGFREDKRTPVSTEEAQAAMQYAKTLASVTDATTLFFRDRTGSFSALGALPKA